MVTIQVGWVNPDAGQQGPAVRSSRVILESDYVPRSSSPIPGRLEVQGGLILVRMKLEAALRELITGDGLSKLRWLLQSEWQPQLQLEQINRLRKAGCNCANPLVGSRDDGRLRCRLCNIEEIDSGSAGEPGSRTPDGQPPAPQPRATEEMLPTTGTSKESNSGPAAETGAGQQGPSGGTDPEPRSEGGPG